MALNLHVPCSYDLGDLPPLGDHERALTLRARKQLRVAHGSASFKVLYFLDYSLILGWDNNETLIRNISLWLEQDNINIRQNLNGSK